MAFVELWHGQDPEYFTVERGHDFSYPVHSHACYELIVTLQGEMTVEVDGVETALRPGMAAFVFPGQLHAIRTEAASAHMLCIFSPDLIGRFTSAARGRVPDCAAFTPGEAVLAMFCALENDSDLYTVKGVLYLVCAALRRQASLTVPQRDGGKLSMLSDILLYVQENCYGECTLSSLCAAVKYDYFYLSKFFKNGTGISFCEYVSMMRVSHAQYLLRTSTDTVLEICSACGFNSLRTFNRTFRRLCGCTPGSYRAAAMG